MIDEKTLRRKIYGCWLGKNIGGTLGGPHEGKSGPLALTYYDPIPETVLPNDDLDLQIVFLHTLLSQQDREVTPDRLAAAWREHVLWPPDEYAVTRRNTAYGLMGPRRGACDNFFGESMGAAIRSELWACLCAGEPARAAAFAWADAVVDHAGDGVHAEVFHAALQAAAFVESDRERLMEIGLAALPDGSPLKAALLRTGDWWRELQDWKGVRQRIIDAYATRNFTSVGCNLCFELLGWLAGGGDFSSAICIAVNCGFDTDCTGATLAALLGIIDPEGIPEKWKRPIGEDVVLSPLIVGLDAPATLDQLTAQTLDLRRQLSGHTPQTRPVILHSPEAEKNSPALRLRMAEARGFRDSDLTAGAAPACLWQDQPCFGHWQQFARESFCGEFRLFRFYFTAEAGRGAKLMVFSWSGAMAWCDGALALNYTASDVAADAFIAPSFHRAACAATELAFDDPAPRQHELIVAVRRPSSRLTDLVVGLGDPTTNYWIPGAFAQVVS